MEWNLTTVLILFGVLLAGYGIGLLEMRRKNAKKLKQAGEALKAALAEKVRGPDMPKAEPSALRLWANPEQKPRLELDGIPLDSLQAVTPEQRRRLIYLVTQIRPWLDGGAIAPAPKPAERPAAPVAFQPKLVVPPAVAAATSLAEKSPAPSTSIVGQIDEILQARLINSPLADKSICLTESPSGGVIVWVGSKNYESVDEIPDPKAVAAIRAAIAEWEDKSR